MKQKPLRDSILQKEVFRQISLSEPIPTLRRTPEECRYRVDAKQHQGLEVPRCQFVELMFEKHQHPDEFPVQRDACLACVTEFEPTPNNFNTVVSSLIYSKIHNLQNAEGECSDLNKLFQQAEKGLRMVIRDVQPPEQQQRKFGDCVDLGAERTESPITAIYDCNHLQHETASSDICNLCSDHRSQDYDESQKLIARLPLTRRGRPIQSWMVGVTTSPRKISTIDQTLDSIIRAGWSSPWLFLDSAVEVAARHQHLPVTYREGATGAWSNFYLSLAELMHRDPNADAYMMLQDDLLLSNSENLRDYLEQVLWPDDETAVVSLFCSAEYDQPDEGWHSLKEQWVWGALAFIFSNQSAWEFISDPKVIAHRKSERFDGTRLIDVTVGEWIQRTKKKIIYPVPSLAQHIGTRSTLWESATNENKRQAEKFIE